MFQLNTLNYYFFGFLFLQELYIKNYVYLAIDTTKRTFEDVYVYVHVF